MKLHHVGVVTKDLQKCVKLYEALGYAEVKIVEDPIQMAWIALMHRSGEPLIELISPTSEQSPAWKWLQRITAGAYHVCYQTASLDETIPFMKERGFSVIMNPVPAVAFDNCRVAFLWSVLTGLVELVELVET